MHRSGLIIVLLAISLILPIVLDAAESNATTKAAAELQNGKTKPEEKLKESAPKADMFNIVADRMEVYKKKGEAYFQGNVKATRQNMTVRSKTMRIYYDNTSKKVVKIIAGGNVVIQMDDREATCDQAMHLPEDEKTILNGNVVITRGKDRATGKRAMIDQKNDIQVMDGGVKLSGSGGKQGGVDINNLFGPSSTQKASETTKTKEKSQPAADRKEVH